MYDIIHMPDGSVVYTVSFYSAERKVYRLSDICRTMYLLDKWGVGPKCLNRGRFFFQPQLELTIYSILDNNNMDLYNYNIFLKNKKKF